jgi:hypothetical protein
VPRKSRRRLVSVGLAAAAALCAVTVASAALTATVASGGQGLGTATLAAPTGAAAANGTCRSNKSIQVDVSWTATSSTFADGYEILRATTSGGPYTSLGTVSGRTTVTYGDTTAAFSTTYYYVVKATKGLWRSTVSNQASDATLNSSCR